MTAVHSGGLAAGVAEGQQGELTHPIHGGHPFSWPPIFDKWIGFPVNRLRSTIFRSDLTMLAAKGSMDIHFNQLIYDNRLRIGRVAWGKSEVTKLTGVSNTEERDLPWFQELMGICVIKIQLLNGEVIATLNFRGCVWPDNIREPSRKPLRHETAVVAAIQAYGNLAERYASGKLDDWVKDAGMADFYAEWEEIEDAGKRLEEVNEFLVKWEKRGKLITK